MIQGLSPREDSFLIGFVQWSISAGAITIKELHQWVYMMIKKYDDLPPYIYYLMEVSDMSQFQETVGFFTRAQLTSDEGKALIGMAYFRGLETEDGEFNISKKSALNALKRNHQLKKRFRETFPFIEF